MRISTVDKGTSNGSALKVNRQNNILQRKRNYIQQQTIVGKSNKTYLVDSEIETEQIFEDDTVLDHNFAFTFLLPQISLKPQVIKITVKCAYNYHL